MTSQPLIPELREAFEADPKHGVSQLAIAISERANDRGLVARVVMLQREMWRVDGPATPEQMAKGRELLQGFAADQEAPLAAGEHSRRVIVNAARKRALSIEVPNAVVLSCTNLETSYRRGDFRLKNVSFARRYGEIAGIVGRNANGKTTLFRLLVGELKWTEPFTTGKP